MAILQEEVIVIKLSRLIKEGVATPDLVTPELIGTIEQVIQELVTDSVVVEVVQ